MPPLRPFEQIDAGGVDARSNPINMPRNRALRCINWVPKQAGFWELRWGYSTVSMSTVSNTAISGLFPYRTWDGTKYVLFVQGTTLNVLNTGTGVVTTPSIRGAAVASSAKGNGYFANNRFHYGNGTDQKWFDGTTWRQNGLPALTTVQIQNIAVTEGVRELTAAQNSSITLTAAAGGSFPADTLTGHLIYVAIFDTSNNEVGPATVFASTGRVTVTLNQKITVGSMPSLAGVNTNWVKLIGGTKDGSNLAYFFFSSQVASGSASRSGTTVTVTTEVNHGFSNGDIIEIASIVGDSSPYLGIYVITVTGLATFTFTIPAAIGPASVLWAATCYKLVVAANATTSIDITAPNYAIGDSATYTGYQANQNRGLAASSVGGSNPGYQFYASIYNPNGGGHAGNRIAIGPVALETAYRSNWHITGLPDLSGTDTEWCILIGRTGDGAAVPYVATDNAGNWAFAQSAQTSFIFTAPLLDGNHELPTRNGIIPSQCNMFCVAGDFVYAGDTGSPFVRRSGDLSQGTNAADIFTGQPEQSWAPDDISTFPTGEALTAMFQTDQEVLAGTVHDCALLVNLAGIEQWVGPYNVGIAGRRAGATCGSHGFFWLSGDKQLITLANGVPTPVSDEYELAELFKIDTSYLSQVELVYYRNAQQGKDELRIEGQVSGVPYTVIHDFKLREFMQAPGSIYGQGYASQFAGELSSAFTIGQVRDANAQLQIYAGAADGQLYQLYTGADDIGNQYTADLILLINGGTNRPSVPFIDFYGDGNIDVQVGQTLSTSLAAGAQFGFDDLTPAANPAQSVQGSENDFLYRAYLDTPEVQHIYARFVLASHSADGNLQLNIPPHIPLENYGRLYELIPAAGDERER